jgi:hypothetical protein
MYAVDVNNLSSEQILKSSHGQLTRVILQFGGWVEVLTTPNHRVPACYKMLQPWAWICWVQPQGFESSPCL